MANTLTFANQTITDAHIFGGISFTHDLNTGEEFSIGNTASASVTFVTDIQLPLYTKDAVNGTFAWTRDSVSRGRYYITEVTKQQGKYTVTAYDAMILADTGISALNLSFPLTVSALATAIATYLGCTVSGTVNNGSISVSSLDESLTVRRLLGYVAEASGCSVKIDGADHLCFMYYASSGITVPASEYLENGLEVADYTCAAIDNVTIFDAAGAVRATYGSGTNTLFIQGNPLLYEATNAVAQVIYSKVSGFNYAPIRCEMFEENGLEVGTTAIFGTTPSLVMHLESSEMGAVASSVGSDSRAELNKSIEVKVNEAMAAATEAQEAVQSVNQHFWYTSSGAEAGAHIAEIPKESFEQNPSGSNLLAKSTGITLRDGTTDLATFSASGASIGKNSDSAVIDFCDGVAVIEGLRASDEQGFTMSTSTDDENVLPWIEIRADSTDNGITQYGTVTVAPGEVGLHSLTYEGSTEVDKSLYVGTTGVMVEGDVDITGQYMINGVPIGGGGSGSGIPYGACSTAAATVQKEVSISGISSLKTGLTIAVRFASANSASNPTLKLNSLTAKAIKRYGSSAAGTGASSSWQAGAVITLTYDGTYWVMHDWNNTTYSTITDAEYQAGTSTSSRLVTPARLKAAILYHAPVTSVNGSTGAVTVTVPTKTSDLTNDSGFLNSVPEADEITFSSSGHWNFFQGVTDVSQALDVVGDYIDDNLSPLIGTTATVTPQDVMTALGAGRDICITATYTYQSIPLALRFTAFNRATDTVNGQVLDYAVSQTIVIVGSDTVLFTLIGGTYQGTAVAWQVDMQVLVNDSTLGSVLNGYVPASREVNNKPLSTNITLTSSDVGAISAPSSASAGDFLVYNGSAWVAQSLSTWQGGNY